MLVQKNAGFRLDIKMVLRTEDIHKTNFKPLQSHSVCIGHMSHMLIFLYIYILILVSTKAKSTYIQPNTSAFSIIDA